MKSELKIEKISNGKWDFGITSSFFRGHGLNEVVSMCVNHLNPRGSLYSDFFSAQARFKCGISGIFGPLEPALAIALKEENIQVSEKDQIGFGPVRTRDLKVRAVLDCLKWDAMGKLQEKSVAELTAVGRPAYNSRCYASMITTDIDGPNAILAAQSVRDLGFWGQKWSLPEGPKQEECGFRRNLERVEKIRKGVGEDTRIMFEAHGQWTVEYFERFTAHAQPYNITWLEDPLPYGSSREYLQLQASSVVPICVGERFSAASQFMPFLRNRNVVVQADIIHCGGYSEVKKLKNYSAREGGTLAFHGRRLVPAFHLAAYIPDGLEILLEYNPFFEPERQTLMGVVNKIIPHQGCLNFHSVQRRGLWELEK